MNGNSLKKIMKECEKKTDKPNCMKNIAQNAIKKNMSQSACFIKPQKQTDMFISSCQFYSNPGTPVYDQKVYSFDRIQSVDLDDANCPMFKLKAERFVNKVNTQQKKKQKSISYEDDFSSDEDLDQVFNKQFLTLRQIRHLQKKQNTKTKEMVESLLRSN